MKGRILRGKKVILRPLSLKDAKNFCKWLSDPEVTRFLERHENPPTLKEERKWILKTNKQNDVVAYSIDSVDGMHIGIVSLNKISAVHKRALFGIFIGDKKYWGQGCGSEATELIVRWGFKDLRLHRVYLSCFAYNIRGYKAYKRCGFREEGRLRHQLFRNGAFHDEIIMGILRDEFFKK